MLLYLGETSFVYTEVSSIAGAIFTISSSTYTIYDCSDDSIVVTGNALINDHIVYALWTPIKIGTYVVNFDYVVGSETRTSRQVIEITETL